jgi:hypothetical protein
MVVAGAILTIHGDPVLDTTILITTGMDVLHELSLLKIIIVDRSMENVAPEAAIL